MDRTNEINELYKKLNIPLQCDQNQKVDFNKKLCTKLFTGKEIRDISLANNTNND